MTVQGFLNVWGATNATAAASYLMWNKTGGDGGTWLLNQKGGAAGGFHFGEVTTAGVVTDRLVIDGNGNATIQWRCDVGRARLARRSMWRTMQRSAPRCMWVAPGRSPGQAPHCRCRITSTQVRSVYRPRCSWQASKEHSPPTGLGLQVSNNMTVGGAFAVTGNAAVGSLGVTGASTFASTTQTGSQSLPLPAAKTGAAYTVAATDCSLVLTPTGTFTLTLPAASSSAGRIIRLKSTAAFAVNSASANIVQLVGGAATAAIMTATAGKTCMLQSDGTNWQIMTAN